MKLLGSPWLLAAAAVLVLIFLVIGLTRRIHAATPDPSSASKLDEALPPSNVTAFKDLQRPNLGEVKEEGVAKTKLGEPSHQENVRPSDLGAPPVSAAYLPMRLRQSGHANATASSANPKANATSSVYPIHGDAQTAKVKPPESFAPYGRLIKCELLLTIDSFAEETPLVGLVTSDLWWNGHLIIPANSEVHGTAKIDRVRDRVISNNRWVVVLGPDRRRIDGTELVLNAIALDRENPQGDDTTWGLDDGSFGLKGDLITTNDAEKIQAFAAAALSAASGSLQTRADDAYGEHTSVTPRNAALAGTQEVLRRLASEITDEIRRHGTFLRVPAGKQFYLYVRETITPGTSKIGGRSASEP